MSGPTMMARKGCWTCKDRKVQCDQGVPTCQRCARAQRDCQGYGLRLSWPRDNDKKRALTGTSPATGMRAPQRHHHLFVNTTCWDVDSYRHLAMQSVVQPPNLVQPSPKLWRQPQPGAKHMELVHFFHDAAYLSLVTFSNTASPIRDVLMHMALTHDTVPGHALFYALLAFSSLRRSGLHQETMQFKVTALHALSASAKGATRGLVEAAQHVAACMLLCAFEILLPSESSGEWLWYIWGAINIVQGARLTQQSNQSDISNLLDWVYYHDTLSQFAMYHWRHDTVALKATYDTSPGHRGVQYPPLVKDRPVLRSPKPTHAILKLFSEVCDTLLDPWDPGSRDEGYKNQLRALEWRISNLPAAPATSTVGAKSCSLSADLSHAVELYQTATLIYLARASQSPWEPPAKRLDSSIDRAFAGHIQAPFCNHFFPLLILACEARTDERRVAILNLIDRTEKRDYMRSMSGFRAGIQSFWVQQDLHADSDLILNYLGLMKAVVSSNNALPSYV